MRSFRYRDKSIKIDLDTISPKIGKIKKENLIIHDTFVDQNDNLLLLVDYSDLDSGFFWITRNQILSSKVENYIKQLKTFQDEDQSACNSSKLFPLPCEKKSRTVGIFLACYNCGPIIS